MPCASAASDFNPRAPCGARLFLRLLKPGEFCISTHAPLAGRDSRSIWLSQAARRFQPTRPLRGATAADWASQISSIFQPTRPLRGATDDDSSTARHGAISTHAPLAGRDGRRRGVDNAGNQISTHAPLAGRDSKSVQITMHIFAITDKFQMLLHRMPPVRAFCSFLMQENHADFGCEPPK